MQELQELIERKPEPEQPAIVGPGWHIYLPMPGIEIQVSIALNVRGYEAFCPAEYRPQRTGRTENGRRVYEVRPVAMIHGYSFVRFEHGQWDFNGVKAVKGVRGFMRIADSRGELVPAGLSDLEVDRLKREDASAFQSYQRLMAKRAAEEAARASGKSEVEFEEGKDVRVDGPLGESWIGKMLQQRGAGRVVILRENAKIIVPHTRVHELVPANCE